MKYQTVEYLEINNNNFQKYDVLNFIWRIRNDPISRKFSVNTEYIDFETHEEWFINKLQNISDSIIFLCLLNNEKVGVVRFEKLSSRNMYEVSIILASQYRGHKFSEKILRGAFENFYNQYVNSSLLARIHIDNKSSEKIFFNLGFEKTDEFTSIQDFSNYVNKETKFQNEKIDFGVINKERKTIGIMQPTFLPWLGYFALLEQVDCFVLLDDVQLSKQSWQVRNRIKNTSEATQWLTLPIKKHSLSAKINEIEISDDKRLVKKIINSFSHNYSKTPYFLEAYDLLSKNIFMNKLSDVTSEIIMDAKSCIGIKTPVYKSSELDIENGPKEQRLVNIINYFGCKEYISPIGSGTYLELDKTKNLFKKNDIEVNYLHFVHPNYRQTGKNFIEQLGIIDCISNVGYENVLNVINLGTNQPTEYPVL